MGEFGRDLRFAIRTLSRSPVLSGVVVLTLALGIGANTALFGLLDQLLLRPLPVPEAERLVVLDGPGPFSGRTHSQSDTLTPFSHAMFSGLRERAEAFEGLMAWSEITLHVGSGDRTDEVPGAIVSGDFFEVLGLQPAQGRLLNPADDVSAGVADLDAVEARRRHPDHGPATGAPRPAPPAAGGGPDRAAGGWSASCWSRACCWGWPAG